jgi:hypothetical protein
MYAQGVQAPWGFLVIDFLGDANLNLGTHCRSQPSASGFLLASAVSRHTNGGSHSTAERALPTSNFTN